MALRAQTASSFAVLSGHSLLDLAGAAIAFAGAVVALAASLAATWLLDPAAWTGYLAMMQAPAIEKEFVPLSLRMPSAFGSGRRPTWLQFLPCALACGWAIIYFTRHRLQWDWLRNGSPLLLVSVLFAPYCYLYDQVLVIPALMDGAYATRSRRLLLGLAAVMVALDIQLAFTKVISLLVSVDRSRVAGVYIFAQAAGGNAAVCSEVGECFIGQSALEDAQMGGWRTQAPE